MTDTYKYIKLVGARRYSCPAINGGQPFVQGQTYKLTERNAKVLLTREYRDAALVMRKVFEETTESEYKATLSLRPPSLTKEDTFEEAPLEPEVTEDQKAEASDEKPAPKRRRGRPRKKKAEATEDAPVEAATVEVTVADSAEAGDSA